MDPRAIERRHIPSGRRGGAQLRRMQPRGAVMIKGPIGDKWPIGVFTSIDAGLGVHLEVARDLGVPTVQVHAPHAGNRSAAAAEKFLKKCEQAQVRVTAVFGGFDGESYAD